MKMRAPQNKWKFKQIFWLQIKFKCKVNLQWIPSADNPSDIITRCDMNTEIRLHRRIFLQLLDYWGGMNRDLMASAANIQRLRNKSPLPFFSQYYEENLKALGTDIFAQNIARAKGDKYPDFCFPRSRWSDFSWNIFPNQKAGVSSYFQSRKRPGVICWKQWRILQESDLWVWKMRTNVSSDLNPTKWNLLEASSKCMPLNKTSECNLILLIL